MASWQEFSQQPPELAKQVRARFDAAESPVLATLRRDGSPRASGTEVDFAGRHIMAGSMLDARKAQDLRRDGRFAVHAFPGGSGHVKTAGVAVQVADPAEIEAGQGNAQSCHLFRLDLAEAVLTQVEGNTLVLPAWRPGKPQVRFERPDNGPVVRIEL
jgi:hypothetical protein